MMKELSVFVDESGDYGNYLIHSPYYIVILIFHDQSVSITENIAALDQALKYITLPVKKIHVGPLIRREDEYRYYTRDLRIKVFRRMFAFAQKVPFTFQTFVLEKKTLEDRIAWNTKLTKAIGAFIKENIQYFLEFDVIKVYYDKGQHDLTVVILTIFNTLLNKIEFKPAKHINYRLLQIADLVCTLQLLSIKAAAKTLSASELSFFESYRVLKKNYLKIIEKKRFKRK